MGHVGIRNEKLFCSRCGQSKAIVYPLPITDLIQLQKEFTDLHKNCEATWEEPKPDMSLPLAIRANWWFINCETGLSSKAMVGTFLNLRMVISPNHYPHDPDDFKRCYKLLKVIPECKSTQYMDKLRRLSPVWDRYVDHWDQLTQMFEQNEAEDWKNYKEIGMYELMQQIIKGDGDIKTD